MNEKSDHFLREFLKPVKKTDDNLSIRLSILFMLKYISPGKFSERQLSEYLESVISDINRSMKKPTSFARNFTSKISAMFKKSKSFYDLQAKLDYWYYTKLLGYGDQYKINDEMISSFITDEKIKNASHPRDAVLFYIYIRSLSFCYSERYGRFNKYVSLLRKIGKTDPHLYAYFLTHVILYDTHFGQKKAPNSAFDALNELHDFCKNELKYKRENVDLMSEIIICCKLCQSYDFPFYQKLVGTIMPTDTFRDYHECAVLAAATF